jgi:hypothetical protein
MRSAAPGLVVLGFVVAAAIAGLTGCMGDVTPEIVAGVDACAECGMVIDRVNQACGYVVKREFVTFDSPVCLLRGCESLRNEAQSVPDAMYFSDYHDASLHAVEKVTFLMTDHVPTVMNGGVVCFASGEAAESMREHSDEVVTDWLGFRTARGEPGVVWDVTVGSGGMIPDVVDAAKGDLVLLRIRAVGIESDLAIAVNGYPEVAPVALPASGETVEIRLLATRPGTGFPVVAIDSDQPLGRLRVSGAHTEDEEAL